jgi:hypothetical protein
MGGAGCGGVAAAHGVKRKSPALITEKRGEIVEKVQVKKHVSAQTWAPPGTRHPAGLAIDVALLHKKDGTWLSVASHFHFFHLAFDVHALL